MNLLNHLAFFIRVIEKRGVASAGRDFGMSASTASDTLLALESHYGAKLLNRTTRSISLTEEGKLLLETARHLVAEANEIEAQIKYGVERLSGTIKISASQDFGSRTLASLIDTFMDTHPDVNVELILEDGFVDLVGQGIDIAIRLGSLKDSTLMVRKLGDNRRVICAAPDYLQQYGTPKHPDDLENHNCLIMKLGSVIDREWTLKVKGRQKSYTVSGDRISNNGSQVYRWCRDGRGLALKSIYDVRADLEEGHLVEVLPDFAVKVESALQAVYPGGGKPPRRIRALIDFLVDSF